MTTQICFATEIEAPDKNKMFADWEGFAPPLLPDK